MHVGILMHVPWIDDQDSMDINYGTFAVISRSYGTHPCNTQYFR